MWDHLPADQLDPDDETRRLIAEKMAGNAGLAPRRWSQTLMEIRALPEALEEAQSDGGGDAP